MKFNIEEFKEWCQQQIVALKTIDNLGDTESIFYSVAKRKELEEYNHVFYRFANLSNRHTREAAVGAVAKVALESPDDTWSGRGNDFRRAGNDGRRNALIKILDYLDYGE